MIAQYDAYAGCIGAFGDTCGTVTETVVREGGVTVLMVRGPGSGVRANILSTFSVRVAISLAQRGEPFEPLVRSLAGSLPAPDGATVNGGDGASFAVVSAAPDGACRAALCGLPRGILLSCGRPSPARRPAPQEQTGAAAGRRILYTSCLLHPGDTLVISGTGLSCPAFGRAEMAEYLSAARSPGRSARELTTLLLNAACWLQNRRPAADLAVLTLRAVRASASSGQHVRTDGIRG